MEKRMLKSLFGGGSSDESSSDEEMESTNEAVGSVVAENENCITYLVPPECK